MYGTKSKSVRMAAGNNQNGEMKKFMNSTMKETQALLRPRIQLIGDKVLQISGYPIVEPDDLASEKKLLLINSFSKTSYNPNTKKQTSKSNNPSSIFPKNGLQGNKLKSPLRNAQKTPDLPKDSNNKARELKFVTTEFS